MFTLVCQRGHTREISPSTLSSGLKPVVNWAYELLTLDQWRPQSVTNTGYYVQTMTLPGQPYGEFQMEEFTFLPHNLTSETA